MIRYLSPIDPHVHLRGLEYETDYAKMAFEDARSVGLCAMAEMPNPNPQLTTWPILRDRFHNMSNHEYGGDYRVKHFINIGLTNDLKQVEDALKLIMEGNFPVKADKVFYTHSTGNMGILDEDYQKEIWKLKGSMGYTGVSIAHFEDEKSYVGEFDYKNPITHSLKQCPEAELVQIERQFKNAVDFGFKGTFYVAHVSNPATIRFLKSQQCRVNFNIIIEMTWHHMFLNHDSYNVSGNGVKMNPPLRSRSMQVELLQHVLDGYVDIIGTDHAPHPYERKFNTDNPASGIPGILFWPKGIELLRSVGINYMILDAMIFHNANRVFNMGLTPTYVERVYQPELWSRYGYNPFESIKC